MSPINLIFSPKQLDESANEDAQATEEQGKLICRLLSLACGAHLVGARPIVFVVRSLVQVICQ